MSPPQNSAPSRNTGSLLEDGEPAPVILAREDGSSPLVIVCDHAGREIPRRLNRLGLHEKELERHIAWDIGAGEVARLLSGDLDAVCIQQRYSRLVIDCNRAPGHPQSIIQLSENTAVPGNGSLSAEDIRVRVLEVFSPYHDTITSVLDRRNSAGKRSIIVAMHSFTPVYHSIARPWEASVLYDRNPKFALLIKDLLLREGIVVGDNEPYRLSDESDYTITRHASARQLPYVEIEVRQDLVSSSDGQVIWASRLSRILRKAVSLLADAT